MRFLWSDGGRERVVELSPEGGGRYRVTVDGAELELEAQALGGDRLQLKTAAGVWSAEITVVGSKRFVRLGALDFVIEREREGKRRPGATPGGGLEAPMPGVVTRVLVAPGDAVRKSQPLVALEAMKMEHLIRSPRDGRVRSVAAVVGEMVNGGVALVELEEEAR